MCFGTHLEYFGRPHILTRPINPLNQKFSYPLQKSRSRRGGVRGNERARDALNVLAGRRQAIFKTSADRYNASCAPVAQLDRASAFEQRRQKF